MRWNRLLCLILVSVLATAGRAERVTEVQKSLCEAAEAGDIERVRSLLVSGADVNAKDVIGLTPLHWASARGHFDVARLLLAKGADVDAKDNMGGETPLHIAAVGGQMAVVELLVAHGADVNARSGSGRTSLHVTAWCDGLDPARFLLGKGANVNARDEDGDTPLHVSLSWGAGAGISELLVRAGADVNAKNGNGTTPLHLAVRNSYVYAVDTAMRADPNKFATEDAIVAAEQHFMMQMVELLVARGADVNVADSEGGTPLHYAVRGAYEHEQVVRFLVTKGADVNVEDCRGGTPLCYAAAYGHEQVIRFLIAKGARADGDSGAAALYEAAEYGHVDVARLLLAHGANIDTTEEGGGTLLHVAAFCGHLEVVELLLSEGVAVNARRRDGQSPLHHAAQGGHADVVQCLVARGADVNAKDSNGATAMLHALRRGHAKVGKLLVAEGAEPVKLPNLSGDVSLHAALRKNDRELVELLLANGIDIELRDSQGETPLHRTAFRGDVELTRSLLLQGADPGVTNWGGRTPLHHAVCAGHKDVVLLLLANGAALGAQDRKGNTALHLAKLLGHTEIADLLARVSSRRANATTDETTGGLASEDAGLSGLRVPLSDAARARRNVKTLVRDNAAFAIALYRQLGSEEGNVFFSPHGISTALAMTYAAARGKTEKEMADTLHFTLGQQDLHPAFAALQATLDGIQRAGNVRLYAASSLWPQQDHPFLDEYLSLVETHYGASVAPVDYRTESARQVARRTINTWVQDRTQGIIRDLVQSDHLHDLTRLVLANAVYFKGDWAYPFDPNKTRNALFHITPNQSTEVPTMNRSGVFGYLEAPDLQILLLPYRGDELSMLLLLPKEIDGLRALAGRLSAQDIDVWRQRLKPNHVIVFLPRFRIAFGIALKPVLQTMGMIDAFRWPGANFAGFDGDSRRFFLDAVVHKALVNVNEEGTEAAAATAVAVAAGMPPPPPVFRADHPFLFLIQENRTKAILFMGRVSDPTSTGQ